MVCFNNVFSVLPFSTYFLCTGMAAAGKELGPMLLLATWQEKDQVAAYLLNQAAVDPMARDPDGRTALHLAAIRDNPALTALLLQHKVTPYKSDGPPPGRHQGLSGPHRPTPAAQGTSIQNS
jgi:hypothetical protein